MGNHTHKIMTTSTTASAALCAQAETSKQRRLKESCVHVATLEFGYLWYRAERNGTVRVHVATALGPDPELAASVAVVTAIVGPLQYVFVVGTVALLSLLLLPLNRRLSC